MCGVFSELWLNIILVTRMADVSHRPPPLFLELLSEPDVPWTLWYLVPSGLNAVSDVGKM